MARPDDCEVKEEEVLDDEMEALQRSEKLTEPNPNQIKHSTTITSSCSLEMPSRGSDVEEEDDSETLGAIEKRFAMYGSDCPIKNLEILLSKRELVHTTSPDLENESTNILSIKKPAPEALDKASTDPQQARSYSQSLESIIPLMSPGYPNPNTISTIFRVIKKNRSYQTCIRIKLVKIKAMVEELKEHIRIHKKFELFSNTKTGRAAYLKKDFNALLVSVRKSTSSHNSKVNDKKLPVLFNGPVENSQVSNYRTALMKFPVSLHRKKWSEKDKENLRKGIEHQFQEMLFQKSVELYSGSDDFSGDSSTLDNNIASISDIEITPEKIRSFIPKVDWQRLASMYAFGRSGAECEARWVNNDDPLINHNSWGNTEDKELISIVQKRGIYNWNEIAATLGTNRTPFQCLSHYQRSLNCHIMKQEWTAEDDAQLCEAVEACGEYDWQQIASKLERRTGAQCSNRWMKTLNPARERVGRWTVEEDRHLKVAVMIFKSKMWHKIAQFVPGRTQVQCRERWVNVLDPSLNLQEWTEEEDTKLKAAIVEHGHCWSKVAASVAPRTDNQCRRRWKILLPREVPLLQAARRIKKSSLISNFVDREDERPGLSSSDFLTLSGIDAPETENGSSSTEKNAKSCTILNKSICEKSPTEAPLTCKEAAMMTDDDIVEPFGGDDSVSKNKKTDKLELKRKRCTEPAHVLNQELPISPQPSILSRTTVGFDTVKFASDGTSLKKKTHKPRGHGDGTRDLQDESVLAVYLELSRTDGAKGNSKLENVLLSKRRKVPKRPSKRNKSTASVKHQEPLSPELPTISRMAAQENQRPSITQTETISPRKMKHAIQDSLMISSNSYDVSGSESGDGQRQIGDGNRASFLHLDTAQTNEELDIKRHTLMEVDDIMPETNNGTGDHRFSVCQGHHTYGEPDAAAHTQEDMITTGSSMAREPDVAAHTEEGIITAGCSMASCSLDYYPCPESIVEDLS